MFCLELFWFSCLVILLWPLGSTRPFQPENCCSLNIFSFSDHFLESMEVIMCENPRRSVVSEKLILDHLAPTKTPHLQSFHSHLTHPSSTLCYLVWTSASRLAHYYMSKCMCSCTYIRPALVFVDTKSATTRYKESGWSWRASWQVTGKNKAWTIKNTQ